MYFNEEIDSSVEALLSVMSLAAQNSTPVISANNLFNSSRVSGHIKELLCNKRWLRWERQAHRSPTSKQRLKTTIDLLRKALEDAKDRSKLSYLEQHSPNRKLYPLWKDKSGICPPIESELPIHIQTGGQYTQQTSFQKLPRFSYSNQEK